VCTTPATIGTFFCLSNCVAITENAIYGSTKPHVLLLKTINSRHDHDRSYEIRGETEKPCGEVVCGVAVPDPRSGKKAANKRIRCFFRKRSFKKLKKSFSPQFLIRGCFYFHFSQQDLLSIVTFAKLKHIQCEDS
jgi:hypothetical protein